MTKHRLTQLLVLATAALTAACTVTDTQPPPLAGPSEMSLSLSVTANPDVLSLDGASQSQIAIDARDANGQPAANVPLRLEILADGTAIDYGTLSARTLVTGSTGRATLTYTAPSLVGGAIPSLEISVTPTGMDASAHIRRLVAIRLVPPGVIAIAPTPRFTFTPANPAAFTNVRFDGSTSTPGLGAAITTYLWNFGDNTTATGVTASHQYAAPGAYYATLTVTDTNGVAAQSAAQAVQVGTGSAPTADFVFSPTAPTIAQDIFFNGSASSPGSASSITSYAWNFGDGTTGSGVTPSKSYAASGTYVVRLTVTNSDGQTATTTANVAVSATANPTSSFTMSPTNPTIGTSVFFNGSSSTAPAGSTITSYAWDFGDGSTGTGVTPSHTYGANFTYTVRLTVTDSTGRTATSTQTLTVSP